MKNDVFISHSSVDCKIATSICEALENAGLSCWISFRSKDLEPGKVYTERIIEAIDTCKVFLLLLSNNSVNSGQVRQELIAANERQRYGLRIFPVIIDKSLNTSDMHHHMGYVLAGKEMVYWEDTEARNELIRQILLSIGNLSTSERAEIVTNIPDPINLIGREKELATISALLKETGKLIITGMDGIGKTALLQAFCNSVIGSTYSTVVYLPIEKCLIRTFDNDDHLTILHKSLLEKKQHLSNYEYALYKLSLFENSVDHSTLVILDNVEFGNDPLLDRICQVNCDLIISSANVSFQKKGFVTFNLKELEHADSVHELFEFHYGKKLSHKEHRSLDMLLSNVGFHTMTVILLAKQMRYFEKAPSDYQNENQLRAERSRNLTGIMSASMHNSGLTEMYTKLLSIYEAYTLTPEEKRVMKTLCLLPSEGLHRYIYIQLLGEQLVPSLIRLEKIGWVQSKKDNTLIMLHPLMRDIVVHKLGIYLNDPDISIFVSSFFALIEDSWSNSFHENTKLKELALSIYYQFPNPSKSLYKEYLLLSKFLWVLNCMETSLEIQNKIKMLFVDEKGLHDNSAEEAEVFLQIGFTYHGKGEYTNAAQELVKAAKIYGNKYAAALSHLAQAYMSIGKKGLNEIEPLLEESLSIRKRHWIGPISEAASYHLYAKTLSTYEEKLDLAIQLEKQAYNIFSEIQPGGVNLSSAAYILGWLYVQTAVDQDDLEYGIGKLEEAKRIRIEHRGDPLHPWMEDIYLKLGKAYAKLDDIQKAKDYFELLLAVRVNKYKGKPSEKQLVEVYELLQDIYWKLGDSEGQKKCSRFLRYRF